MDPFLSALSGRSSSSGVPVWLMRQAGRTLPEYRRLRARHADFKTLLCEPELAVEISLQPVRRYGVDACILFSDILVLCEAMGANYELVGQKGPFFPHPVRTAKDVGQLRLNEPAQDVDYVLRTLRELRRTCDKPVIGFSGAPWTLFAYMVEGESSKTFSKARQFFHQASTSLRSAFLNLLTDNIIRYLKAQAEAGAQALQLFDTLADLLSAEDYRTHMLPCLRKIGLAMEACDVPLMFFLKGVHFLWCELKDLPCAGFSLDWQTSPEAVKKHMKGKVLQGNLDPAVLYGSRAHIRCATRGMLQSFEGVPYVANLGHGVYPDTDWQKIACFVDAVHEYSA